MFIFEIVIFAGLFFWINNLVGRISKLEKKMILLNFETEKEDSKVQKSEVEKAGYESQSGAKRPGALHSLVKWISTDWMLKVGALLIILAIAWFVTYAFLNSWIGPVGRISLGLMFGTIVMGASFKLFKKYPIQAEVLLVLGAASILITLFSARSLYGFFTPSSALIIMGMVVVVLAVTAVKRNLQSLAFASLFAGVVSPIMTDGLITIWGSTSVANNLLLTSFLLILSFGMYLIVAKRGWNKLLLFTVLSIFLYSESILYPLSDLVTWAFMTAFFVLFTVGTLSMIIKNKKVEHVDLLTSTLLVLMLIFWVTEFVPEVFQSIVLAVMTIFTIVSASFARKLKAPKNVVYLQSAIAIGLIGAATVIEFAGDTSTLTIVLSLESLAIVLVAAFGMKDIKAATAVSFLQIFPFVLSLEKLEYRHWNQLFGEHFLVLLISAVSLEATSFTLRTLRSKDKKVEDLRINSLIAYAVAAVFTVFGIIWRSLEVLIMNESYAHGVALILFTILGVIFYFIGLKKENNPLRIGGMILLGLITLRLLFIDIWDMSLTGKIFTFITIGGLLITTAFFKKAKK